MANMNVPRPTDASIILTYRCPMRCVMCNIWKNPMLVFLSQKLFRVSEPVARSVRLPRQQGLLHRR